MRWIPFFSSQHLCWNIFYLFSIVLKSLKKVFVTFASNTKAITLPQTLFKIYSKICVAIRPFACRQSLIVSIRNIMFVWMSGFCWITWNATVLLKCLLPFSVATMAFKSIVRQVPHFILHLVLEFYSNQTLFIISFTVFDLNVNHDCLSFSQFF